MEGTSGAERALRPQGSPRGCNRTKSCRGPPENDGNHGGIIYRDHLQGGELRLWRCKATLLRCDDTKTQGQNGDLSQPWHELPHGQSTISTPSSLHTPPSPSLFAPTLLSSASQAPDPCGSEPALRLRLSPDQSLADRSLFVPKL